MAESTGSRTTTTGGSASRSLGRRITRAQGAPVAAVLLLLALGYAALAAHQTVHLRRVRVDGLVTDGATVVAADARWPGIRPGDRVVAIAGGSLENRSVTHRVAEVPVHDDATLRATGPGGDVVVPVVAEALPPHHAASAWVRFLVGALTLLLGALGFALRPGSRIAWVFLAFCVAVEVNLLFPLAFAPWLVLFPVTQALAFALSTSLGVHTFCELPRRPPLVERYPWIPLVVHLPVLAILAWCIVTPRSEWPGLAAATGSLGGCIVSLVILAAGARRAHRAGDALLLGQYRVLIGGVTIGLLLPVAVHVGRSIAGIDDKWIVHLNAVPVVVYPATIAFALLKRNVLGADRYTAMIVAYAATLALVVVAGLIVLVGVPLAVTGQVGASPTVLVLTTAIASLGAAPLYRRLKRAVDRRFQRGGASAERLNARLREVVRVVATGDRDSALGGAFDALAPLGAERAAIYALDPARGGLLLERATVDLPPRIDGDGPLARALRLDAPGGVDAFAATALPYDAQDQLWSLGLALAAAVPVRGVVGGFVAVGPRAAGSRYTSAEQSYLALLAAQIGLVLERGADGGQVGRYRIEKRLGVGGMAEVHLAWQVGPGGFERRVALKRPLPHVAEDPDLVAMFLDEARLAANLRHANIAQVLEVGRDGATYFIAMEYVDGVSLRGLLRAGRRRPVGLPRALAIVDALLAALGAAHDAADARGRPMHLIHRDVTPSNVLVDHDGVVKLVDFGIAHAAARLHVTRAGQVKGTPMYMSPEQKAGHELDRRSDLFSAGVILYELLVGRPPWPDGPPPRPTALPALDGIGQRMTAFLARALAWDPAERFETAAEMRTTLAAAAAPVLPSPATDLAAAVAAARETAAELVPAAEDATLAAVDTALPTE